MKTKINGMNQNRLLEHSCDTTDLLILQWMNQRMETAPADVTLGADQYWLANPRQILDDLPILGLQPRTVQQRLSRLVQENILTRISVGTGQQNASYYGQNTNWAALKGGQQ